MASAKEITDHFINRAMHLNEFIVTTDVPDEFRFNGTIPFDMEIKENIIHAKVWAISFDEAAQRLDTWLETCK